jgi:hypothetical protein
MCAQDFPDFFALSTFCTPPVVFFEVAGELGVSVVEIEKCRNPKTPSCYVDIQPENFGP